MNPGLFEVSGEGGCSMLEAWNNDSHMYDGKKEKKKALKGRYEILENFIGSHLHSPPSRISREFVRNSLEYLKGKPQFAYPTKLKFKYSYRPFFFSFFF